MLAALFQLKSEPFLHTTWAETKEHKEAEAQKVLQPLPSSVASESFNFNRSKWWASKKKKNRNTDIYIRIKDFLYELNTLET